MIEFVKKGQVAVICDGQYGSTGKGSIAGYMALNSNQCDIAVTNASANAGHWTKLSKDESFCTHHIPTFGVIQDKCLIYLDAGSVINPTVLWEEVTRTGIDSKRIMIHPRAAIILQKHINAENRNLSSTTKIGSTRQGVGAALADKIMRKGNVAENSDQLRQSYTITDINLNIRMSLGRSVVLEIPQGYSLSLNSQFYPHVTSRNCTVVAGMADAGIHPSRLGRVLMTLRTYPIRVGNILAADGAIIGFSGKIYPDQGELSWGGDFPDIEPEYTTVTGRKRRIFTFSETQLIDAVIDNRPDILFLNFINYMKSTGEISYLVNRIIENYMTIMGGFPHMLYGHGPLVTDITTDWKRENNEPL